MKKFKGSLSYVETPASAITHWWGVRADRVDEDDSSILLMSETALASVSELMSGCEVGDALFPDPLPQFSSCPSTSDDPVLSKMDHRLGETRLRHELEHMFQRRGLHPPHRVGVRRIANKSNVGRPTSTSAYKVSEVCEWLWDVVASHLDMNMMERVGESAMKALQSNSGYSLALYRFSKRAVQKRSSWPKDDIQFGRAATALAAALPAQDKELLQPSSLDVVLDVVVETLMFATGIEEAVDREILRDHLSPICTQLEPTRFLAKTLMRTAMLEEVLGPSLSLRLRTYAYERDWMLDLSDPHLHSSHVASEHGLLQSVVKELAQSRQQLHSVRMNLADGILSRAREAAGPSFVPARDSKLTLPGRAATKHNHPFRQNKLVAARIALHEAAVAVVSFNAAVAHISDMQQYFADKFGVKKGDPGYRKTWTWRLCQYLPLLNDAVEMYAADLIAKVCFLCYVVLGNLLTPCALRVALDRSASAEILELIVHVLWRGRQEAIGEPGKYTNPCDVLASWRTFFSCNLSALADNRAINPPTLHMASYGSQRHASLTHLEALASLAMSHRLNPLSTQVCGSKSLGFIAYFSLIDQNGSSHDTRINCPSLGATGSAI